MELQLKPAAYRTTEEERRLLAPEDGPGIGAVAWEGALTAWNGWELAAMPATPPMLGYRGQPTAGVLAEQRYEVTAAAQNSFTIRLMVTNTTGAPQTVQPWLLGGRLLHDPLERGRYRLLRAQVGGKVHTLSLPPSVVSRRWEGPVGWVTAQTKYSTAIVQPTTPAVALVVARDLHGQPQGWIEWPATIVLPGGTASWTLRGYVGPLDYRFLDALELDHAASLGAFTTITRLLQAGLNGLTGLLRSHGAAIVALTMLLSLGFYPLTWASFRTMKKMEILQPEIRALQERYAKDSKRLNEEVMKAYRKHRVNPVAGCLPLLLQLPIFMALYQVLSRSPQLRGARFLLIKDLSAPDALIPLPAVLPLVGSALNVLPLAMAGMMFVQQRMTTRGRGALTEEQRVQQQVFGFMPLLFGAMFYTLPSALVLYWLLNTTLVVCQQQLMLRRMT